jgi:putative transcription factor
MPQDDAQSCELCGSETKVIIRAEIEGVQFNVCPQCARHGTVVHKVHSEPDMRVRRRPPRRDIEIHERVMDDFAIKIKQARERRGLKQEELAKHINEKSSVIHSLESGKHKPDLALARKISRFLNIVLVEELKEEEGPELSRGASASFTLGDFIRDS